MSVRKRLERTHKLHIVQDGRDVIPECLLERIGADLFTSIACGTIFEDDAGLTSALYKKVQSNTLLKIKYTFKS